MEFKWIVSIGTLNFFTSAHFCEASFGGDMKFWTCPFALGCFRSATQDVLSAKSSTNVSSPNKSATWLGSWIISTVVVAQRNQGFLGSRKLETQHVYRKFWAISVVFCEGYFHRSMKDGWPLGTAEWKLHGFQVIWETICPPSLHGPMIFLHITLECINFGAPKPRFGHDHRNESSSIKALKVPRCFSCFPTYQQ